MEYIYAALLLHSAGKEINEENLKAVLQAAGIEVDEARIKALVAGLEGVNIDEAIANAAMPVAVAAPAPAVEEKKEEAKEEKKEEKKEEETAAVAGLAALFG
ncbi:50S ribosomal protein L12P [Methanocaldococcus villosus KIN24-T80]|uniref:Large ribosomal subunit protein P1 n=1 Tax=Methanocaldococcus villosus KIN24-T80 TaxID=1069083 RepID=N6V0B2_9EURY|nr:50S ribosomal protein P1 [Methanocaldococcus villosus]ENN95758.1 50S ribosomal protein L12P [Methanocaldococcus villosus KIN24-T80]